MNKKPKVGEELLFALSERIRVKGAYDLGQPEQVTVPAYMQNASLGGHLDYNSIWDSKSGRWRVCWDDIEGNGRRINNKFSTARAAHRWVERTAAKEFPGHRLKHSSGRKNWHYRDGD